MWAFKYLGEVFVRQNKRSRHVEALISFLPFNTNRFTSTSVMHANIHRANMRGKVGGVYIQTFAVISMAKTRIYFFENHENAEFRIAATGTVLQWTRGGGLCRRRYY